MRSPEATARLAWWVLGAAAVCFLLFCVLIGYGLWGLRATIMGSPEGNVLVANASPVSLIHAQEVQAIAVPPGQKIALREGETVQVESSAPPGAVALVMLWDKSTLQLYAGTRVTLSRLQATLYSRQSQEVVLDMAAGQVLLGVAQMGQYQQIHFSVHFPDGVAALLDPGGSYLLRTGDRTEIAVRQGRAQVTVGPDGLVTLVQAEEKAVVLAGGPPVVGPARWSLLLNGDFAQGLQDWSFHSDQAEDGGTVDATYHLEQQNIDGQLVWTVGLERKGGVADRCQAILSQPVKEDISAYHSVRLDFDLRINYQSLPGGGNLGVDYPFNVRINYQDAEGLSRQYTYGFYDHTEPGFKTSFPNQIQGETSLSPHYRWEHFELELLNIQPRPVLLNGIDLFASGNDYLSWVADVSLIAE
jgi:hypothetical protein